MHVALVGTYPPAPCGIATFTADVTYDFVTGLDSNNNSFMTGVGGGISNFRILGIEVSANVDPADPLAFRTGLTFEGVGTADFSQTGIADTIYVDQASDFVVTTQGANAGNNASALDTGDTVTWFGSPGTADDVTGLIFGHTAFATIQTAVNAVVYFGTTIQLAPGTYTESVSLDRSLSLVGTADAFLDGGDVNRVLHVAAGANVSISDVTIQNGAAGFGAGVWNEGTLTIVNSTLADNFAIGFNGGGLNPSTGEGGGGGSAGLGGAIFNDGLLTIRNSTISGNVARGGNGGFGGLSGSGGGGGGLNGAGGVPTGGANGGGAGGTSGNSGANGGFGGGGGAGMGGAIFNRGGTITLTNSTISGNSAVGGLRGELAASAFGQPGVAGSGFGGGVFNLNGTIEVLSSTLSGNMATNGGAAVGTGAGGGVFNLAHATAAASGITATAATLTLQNTIVANSVATSDVANEQRAGASTSTVTASDFNIVEAPIVNTRAARTVTNALLRAMNFILASPFPYAGRPR